VGGAKAFVPNPLPPKLLWDNSLTGTISAATLALGRLDGVARDLPNPHLLIRPFLSREAVLSSQIEGTQASIPDLLLFEIDEKVEQGVPDVREVVNYVRTLEFGLNRRTSLPLSLRLIRDLHRVLMEGVRGKDRQPGEFRRSQVHIGPEGAGLENATFVPPPPAQLTRLLDQLEKFLHAPSDLPPVVRLALVHYQFEAIHPFLDGNGRVGRALITLMLCLDGILSLPMLYLSAYFHRTRQEYYQRLLDVSLKGCWTEWIGYFAQGVTSEAMDAVNRTQMLKKLQTRMA
jgi:Fic family protein